MTREAANSAPEWAAHSGDVWARRWPETGRALSDLARQLDQSIAELAPNGRFRALDIGCGAGETSERLASVRPDAAIIASDVSPALAQVAQDRLATLPNVRVLLGDAEDIAARESPFDLLYSRHGVMFFEDPVKAFRGFRAAASAGAALVFSCFQHWASNPWASDLASEAAGRSLPPPGREPSGFAFAEPSYVREIFRESGWAERELRPIEFRYVAGEGDEAIDEAMDFLAEIGPASRVIASLPEQERSGALKRMRAVIERHFDGRAVEFTAAAWIWSARVEGEVR